MEKSDRIPGRFLKLLYIIIEKAVMNKWERIDKEQVDYACQEENKNYQSEATLSDENPLPKTKVEL